MKSYTSRQSLFLALLLVLSKAIPSNAQDRDRERREAIARELVDTEKIAASGVASDEERQKLLEKRKAHRERVRSLSSEEKQFLREERQAQKEGEAEGSRPILKTESDKQRFQEERKAERQKLRTMTKEERQKHRDERLADRKKENQVFDEQRGAMLNGGGEAVKTPIDKEALLKSQMDAKAKLDEQMARLTKVVDRKKQDEAVKTPLDKKALLKAQTDSQAVLDEQMARLMKALERKKQKQAQQEL